MEYELLKYAEELAGRFPENVEDIVVCHRSKLVKQDEPEDSKQELFWVMDGRTTPIASEMWVKYDEMLRLESSDGNNEVEPSLFSQIRTQTDVDNTADESFSSSPIVYPRAVGRKSPYQPTKVAAEDVPQEKRVKFSEALPSAELFDMIHTNSHSHSSNDPMNDTLAHMNTPMRSAQYRAMYDTITSPFQPRISSRTTRQETSPHTPLLTQLDQLAVNDDSYDQNTPSQFLSDVVTPTQKAVQARNVHQEDEEEEEEKEEVVVSPTEKQNMHDRSFDGEEEEEPLSPLLLHSTATTHTTHTTHTSSSSHDDPTTTMSNSFQPKNLLSLLDAQSEEKEQIVSSNPDTTPNVSRLDIYGHTSPSPTPRQEHEEHNTSSLTPSNDPMVIETVKTETETATEDMLMIDTSDLLDGLCYDDFYSQLPTDPTDNTVAEELPQTTTRTRTNTRTNTRTSIHTSREMTTSSSSTPVRSVNTHDKEEEDKDDEDPLALATWPGYLWPRCVPFQLPFPAQILPLTAQEGVIVYWLQSCFRIEENFAFQAALHLASQKSMPVVVLTIIDEEIIQDMYRYHAQQVTQRHEKHQKRVQDKQKRLLAQQIQQQQEEKMKFATPSSLLPARFQPSSGKKPVHPNKYIPSKPINTTNTTNTSINTAINTINTSTNTINTTSSSSSSYQTPYKSIPNARNTNTTRSVYSTEKTPSSSSTSGNTSNTSGNSSSTGSSTSSSMGKHHSLSYTTPKDYPKSNPKDAPKSNPKVDPKSDPITYPPSTHTPHSTMPPPPPPPIHHILSTAYPDLGFGYERITVEDAFRARSLARIEQLLQLQQELETRFHIPLVTFTHRHDGMHMVNGGGEGVVMTRAKVLEEVILNSFWTDTRSHISQPKSHQKSQEISHISHQKTPISHTSPQPKSHPKSHQKVFAVFTDELMHPFSRCVSAHLATLPLPTPYTGYRIPVLAFECNTIAYPCRHLVSEKMSDEMSEVRTRHHTQSEYIQSFEKFQETFVAEYMLTKNNKNANKSSYEEKSVFQQQAFLDKIHSLQKSLDYEEIRSPTTTTEQETETQEKHPLTSMDGGDETTTNTNTNTKKQKCTPPSPPSIQLPALFLSTHSTDHCCMKMQLHSYTHNHNHPIAVTAVPVVGDNTETKKLMIGVVDWKEMRTLYGYERMEGIMDGVEEEEEVVDGHENENEKVVSSVEGVVIPTMTEYGTQLGQRLMEVIQQATSAETTFAETTFAKTTSGETTYEKTTSAKTTSAETTSGETTSAETTSAKTTFEKTTSGETTSGDCLLVLPAQLRILEEEFLTAYRHGKLPVSYYTTLFTTTIPSSPEHDETMSKTRTLFRTFLDTLLDKVVYMEYSKVSCYGSRRLSCTPLYSTVTGKVQWYIPWYDVFPVSTMSVLLDPVHSLLVALRTLARACTTTTPSTPTSEPLIALLRPETPKNTNKHTKTLSAFFGGASSLTTPYQLHTSFTGNPLFNTVQRWLHTTGDTFVSIPVKVYWLLYYLVALPTIELGVNIAFQEYMIYGGLYVPPSMMSGGEEEVTKNTINSKNTINTINTINTKNAINTINTNNTTINTINTTINTKNTINTTINTLKYVRGSACVVEEDFVLASEFMQLVILTGEYLEEMHRTYQQTVGQSWDIQQKKRQEKLCLKKVSKQSPQPPIPQPQPQEEEYHHMIYDVPPSDKPSKPSKSSSSRSTKSKSSSSSSSSNNNNHNNNNNNNNNKEEEGEEEEEKVGRMISFEEYFVQQYELLEETVKAEMAKKNAGIIVG